MLEIVYEVDDGRTPYHGYTMSVFEMPTRVTQSGYKSAHAHKSTRVMQSRTTRVVNKMETPYGY